MSVLVACTTCLSPIINRFQSVYGCGLTALFEWIVFHIVGMLDKETYKQRVERTLFSGNARVAWQGIKSMASAAHIGRRKTSADLGGYGQNMANELNVFFLKI